MAPLYKNKAFITRVHFIAKYFVKDEEGKVRIKKLR